MRSTSAKLRKLTCYIQQPQVVCKRAPALRNRIARNIFDPPKQIYFSITLLGFTNVNNAIFVKSTSAKIRKLTCYIQRPIRDPLVLNPLLLVPRLIWSIYRSARVASSTMGGPHGHCKFGWGCIS